MRSRRPRRGLSSVYGFIMVYLLAIASLQAISVSMSSAQGADAAAQQAGQVAQMRSLERLDVALSPGGNVTVTNVGLIPSRVSLLLVQGRNSSQVVQVQQPIPVGGSAVIETGAASPSAVAVVTSLGDVFESSGGRAAPGLLGVQTLEVGVGGPGVDAQVYQNPSDPSRFFLAEGSDVQEFSSSTGAAGWAFDAGVGEVTDVLPLTGGGVYASDGYYGDQFTSALFYLSPAGAPTADYTMRLLRLFTTVEVQYPNNGQAPYPVGSQPVQKGGDSLYAYYDGWFLSSAGLSPTTVPSDSYNLEASDAGQFYLYETSNNPGGFGCTYPRGNLVTVFAYSAGSQGVQERWSAPLYLDACDEYPNQVVAASAGSGVLVSLFSQTYWSQPTYYGGPYPGSNPFLAVLSSSSGAVLRSGTLDSNGYTSAATDGAEVYLAIPSSDEVEVLGATGAGGGTFYDVGIPASYLLWEDGYLFAVSSDQVNVYTQSMSLVRSLDFAPYSFYSRSNSKPLEPQMAQPSFLVLNSTSYLALLRNSTGFGTLVEGSY
ncbi:MAG: hypothetical protein JRM90_01865 [Nitrososphaerota archaeon]|nr:hypothetical protein [Nitrososphaerota archaeon]